MRPNRLSATMALALADAVAHGGKLIRHPGGFWSWPGCPRGFAGIPTEYYGTPTVQALVVRRKLKYTEWRDGARVRFPIVAEIPQ